MAFPTLEPDISSIREAAEAAILYGIMEADAKEDAADSARVRTAWSANGQVCLPCVDEEEDDDNDVEMEAAERDSDDDSDHDDMMPTMTTGKLARRLVLQISSALPHLVAFHYNLLFLPSCCAYVLVVCSPCPDGGAGAGRLQHLGCCAETISRVVSTRPRTFAYPCA